ncbi:MAG: sulfatase [Planctomycetota bacterium]
MHRANPISVLCLLWAASFGCSQQAEPRLPNIILLSIDTLRADHLSCYGADQATSPWIDRLAAKGARFVDVISHSPSTAPSHMSIFTSTYPGVHGVHIRDEGLRFGRLPEKLQSLPEVLQAQGYRTAAFTGGAQVTAGFGFERGFEVYKEDMFRLEDQDFDPVLDWLAKVGPDEPFFLFLHTYEVHAPYQPPAPYDTLFDPDYTGRISGEWNEKEWFDKLMALRPLDDREVRHLKALYDGEILYTDQAFSRFFKTLAEKGLFGNEKTLLILTSDHGEEFMEHGRLAHMQLYQEIMKVPLIFYWPGVIPEGVVVPGQVRLIDLVPTLFDCVGMPAWPQAQGVSLKTWIQAGSRETLPAFSENHHQKDERTLRIDDFTYYARGKKGAELYARDMDSGERKNLLGPGQDRGQYKSITDTLGKAVDAFLMENEKHRNRLGILDAAEGTDDIHSDKDKDLEERLRTLGYIQ